MEISKENLYVDMVDWTYLITGNQDWWDLDYERPCKTAVPRNTYRFVILLVKLHGIDLFWVHSASSGFSTLDAESLPSLLSPLLRPAWETTVRRVILDLPMDGLLIFTV